MSTWKALTLKDAFERMPTAKVFVVFSVGTENVELEVIGAHGVSVPRGQILLQVKGGKHFG